MLLFFLAVFFFSLQEQTRVTYAWKTNKIHNNKHLFLVSLKHVNFKVFMYHINHAFSYFLIDFYVPH